MAETVSPVVGQTIVAIRPMTEKELQAEDWMVETINGTPVALVLSNGAVLYPSMDPEGNGGGALFGMDQDGVLFRVQSER